MIRWPLVVALGLVACAKASDEGEAKQWAKDPPKKVEIPASLSIDVVIDGANAPAITGDLLRTTKPDFADEERTAWRIPTLVAAAAPAGSTVEAVGTQGISVKFARPMVDGLEPVLFLTRRGEVNVEAVDPKDPFPHYHGKGGRLHRVGDSLPHVEKVVRLEITHPKS